jgi:hypothetical protein
MYYVAIIETGNKRDIRIIFYSITNIYTNYLDKVILPIYYEPQCLSFIHINDSIACIYTS